MKKYIIRVRDISHKEYEVEAIDRFEAFLKVKNGQAKEIGAGTTGGVVGNDDIYEMPSSSHNNNE